MAGGLLMPSGAARRPFITSGVFMLTIPASPKAAAGWPVAASSAISLPDRVPKKMRAPFPLAPGQ